MSFKTTDKNKKTSASAPVVHKVLSSPGRSLETDTRTFMESKFGHDFSKVKVHTDPMAAESADSMNARAYTVGRNIIFNAEQYNPLTDSGKKLLSHELAHVVQQGKGFSEYGHSSAKENSDNCEQEAENISTEIARNKPLTVNSRQTVTIQRAPEERVLIWRNQHLHSWQQLSARSL